MVLYQDTLASQIKDLTLYNSRYGLASSFHISQSNATRTKELCHMCKAAGEM